MNKKIIIILTLVISLGGISSILVIRYRSKNQNSLEVKEEEKKEEEKETKEEENKEESKSEEKKEEKEEEKKEEEKKEENKVKSEEKQEEKEEEKEGKITDILWSYNWKGTLCVLVVCSIISAIISAFLSAISVKCKGGLLCKGDLFKDFFQSYAGIFVFIFEFIFYPFALTIKKFGKKNIFQNLRKVLPKLYSILKIIIDIIAAATFFRSIIILKDTCKKKPQKNLGTTGSGDSEQQSGENHQGQ